MNTRKFVLSELLAVNIVAKIEDVGKLEAFLRDARPERETEKWVEGVWRGIEGLGRDAKRVGVGRRTMETWRELWECTLLVAKRGVHDFHTMIPGEGS